MSNPSTLAELRETLLPLVIANQEGIITEVNSAFEQLTNWKQAEIKGQMISIILPVYFRDAHHLGFSRFRSTEVAQVLNHPLELKVITKDNQEILSEHYIIAEKINGQWFFGATLRPIEI